MCQRIICHGRCIGWLNGFGFYIPHDSTDVAAREIPWQHEQLFAVRRAEGYLARVTRLPNQPFGSADFIIGKIPCFKHEPLVRVGMVAQFMSIGNDAAGNFWIAFQLAAHCIERGGNAVLL